MRFGATFSPRRVSPAGPGRGLARPEFARIVRFSYLTPLALLPILFAVFIPQLGDLSSDYTFLEHADLVRVHTNRALRMLLDSETGVRGFQLTGDRDFLQPYQGAC